MLWKIDRAYRGGKSTMVLAAHSGMDGLAIVCIHSPLFHRCFF